MAHDVFICHSSHDKPVADAVCSGLEAAGIRCWIAPRDIEPSSSWAAAIIDAIAASRAVVVVFSAQANTSPQVMREVERAVHRGVTVVPFRIDDVVPSKEMEYFLSAPHWLDALTPPMEQHIQRLAASLSRMLGREAPEAPPFARPAAPQPAAPARPRRVGVLTGALAGALLGALALAWFVRGAGVEEPAPGAAALRAEAGAAAPAPPAAVSGAAQPEDPPAERGATAAPPLPERQPAAPVAAEQAPPSVEGTWRYTESAGQVGSRYWCSIQGTMRFAQDGERLEMRYDQGGECVIDGSTVDGAGQGQGRGTVRDGRIEFTVDTCRFTGEMSGRDAIDGRSVCRMRDPQGAEYTVEGYWSARRA